MRLCPIPYTPKCRTLTPVSSLCRAHLEGGCPVDEAHVAHFARQLLGALFSVHCSFNLIYYLQPFHGQPRVHCARSAWFWWPPYLNNWQRLSDLYAWRHATVLCATAKVKAPGWSSGPAWLLSTGRSQKVPCVGADLAWSRSSAGGNESHAVDFKS